MTHEVVNQTPPRVDLDEFATNLPLVEGLARHQADWAAPAAVEAGRLVGSAQFQEWAEEANANAPRLVAYDRVGNRVDEVCYHPAYHEVMGRAVAAGNHAAPWRRPRPGAHVARAATFMLYAQVEPGHACPISMTYSVVPALRAESVLAKTWEPLICGLGYDPVLGPPLDKPGVVFGMAMTEKQGGSDVRANTTRAVPTAGGDGEVDAYLLTGHKWFCSAPMSDAFLVLAQADGGLTCFLVPRVLADGTRNPFHIQRLKDKLGNRANASGEIELDDTWAARVGPVGRGVRTIIEMVNHTRLDCVLASTAGMRQCVTEATWHAAHRRAFGRLLAEQPLMQSVLADLCLESEAATAAALRLARAYDEDASESERLFRRLATAVVKYWVCKRGPHHAYEAMECLGGNGYCETFPLARRYREQPVMAVWEGSGNVICLDVLRAIAREPETVGAFMDEVTEAGAANQAFFAHTRMLAGALATPQDVSEARARKLVEDLALALQASLLLRYAPPEVADAFCASRLGGGGYEFGTLPPGVDAASIVARHSPETT